MWSARCSTALYLQPDLMPDAGRKSIRCADPGRVQGNDALLWPGRSGGSVPMCAGAAPLVQHNCAWRRHGWRFYRPNRPSSGPAGVLPDPRLEDARLCLPRTGVKQRQWPGTGCLSSSWGCSAAHRRLRYLHKLPILASSCLFPLAIKNRHTADKVRSSRVDSLLLLWM
jgi:hypothetical protein